MKIALAQMKMDTDIEKYFHKSLQLMDAYLWTA